ncbi:MAG: polysaccharide biosynthesis/export family protein [Pseudolabrys sp.]
MYPFVGRGVLRLAFCAVLLTSAVGLAGCNDYSDASSATGMELASARTVSRPVAIGVGPRTYVLRPNDQIRVQVYNEPNATGVYTIDGGGYVSVPLAGRVRAAGLTPAELERSITKHVDGSILKDPHVNVQVATYGPIYIRGEVKQPGQFPYAPGLTIGDAVALAGGYTYRADESVAYVRSSASPQEVARPLRTDLPVAPGDNIRIPERFF